MSVFFFDFEIPVEYIPEQIFHNEFEEIDVDFPEIDNFKDSPEGQIPETETTPDDFQDLVPDDYSLGDDLDYGQEEDSQELNIKRIIELTNSERVNHNLNSVEESYTLNLAAQKKAEDMFERQYFAHTAPTGEEASDLVSQFDYDFILVGENLAKGNFKSSEDLVEGWMNSPDHRENILKDGYEQIGIGIKQGYYEGREIWMAVQIFGTPSSSCPEPDSYLLMSIEETEARVEDIMKEIEKIDGQLDQYSGSRYNEKVEERNRLAEKYNYLREDLRGLIDEYNKQVNDRNECVEGY